MALASGTSLAVPPAALEALSRVMKEEGQTVDVLLDFK